MGPSKDGLPFATETDLLRAERGQEGSVQFHIPEPQHFQYLIRWVVCVSLVDDVRFDLLLAPSNLAFDAGSVWGGPRRQ
jgi:hypothetical protein